MRWAVISALLVVSCSSSSSDDTTTTEPTATASGFIGALCDLDTSCCTAAKKTYDGVACRTSLASLQNERAYDAAAGRTCIAALKASGAAYCDTGSNVTACKSVFVSASTVADAGNDATHGKQGDNCASTRRKDGTVEQLGASPGASGAICWNDDNLFCDPASQICKPRQGAGAPCQTASSLDCVAGTQCNVPKTGGGNMQCVALLPEGSPCVANSRYAEESCAEGLTCNDGSCTAFGTGSLSGASDVSNVACK